MEKQNNKNFVDIIKNHPLHAGISLATTFFMVIGGIYLRIESKYIDQLKSNIDILNIHNKELQNKVDSIKDLENKIEILKINIESYKQKNDILSDKISSIEKENYPVKLNELQIELATRIEDLKLTKINCQKEIQGLKNESSVLDSIVKVQNKGLSTLKNVNRQTVEESKLNKCNQELSKFDKQISLLSLENSKIKSVLKNSTLGTKNNDIDLRKNFVESAVQSLKGISSDISSSSSFISIVNNSNFQLTGEEYLLIFQSVNFSSDIPRQSAIINTINKIKFPISSDVVKGLVSDFSTDIPRSIVARVIAEHQSGNNN